MQVTVNDVRLQRPHRLDEADKETREIPAMLFSQAECFYACGLERIFKNTGVEVYHCDLKRLLSSQRTGQ